MDGKHTHISIRYENNYMEITKQLKDFTNFITSPPKMYKKRSS
jgi:hypothetical protein